MPQNFGEILTEKEIKDLVGYLIENSAAGEAGGGGKTQG
jgi:hypothetical protein